MRVLTLGTFDLFHPGHVYLLRRAADFGGVHVGVNSDRFVEQYKGQPAVDRERKRMHVVERCRYVTRVHLNDGPGRELIERIRPSLIVVGGDWLAHDYLDQIDTPADVLQDIGCDVLFIARKPGYSTTQARAAA
jgi:cytidyltransferase-like protein